MKGSPSHPWATKSHLPSRVRRNKEGVLDSATQMTPSASTAKPFGRPVCLITDLVRPSALIRVTQPRPAAASTISQLPSGKATGPSGAPRSPVKIIGSFDPLDLRGLAAVDKQHGAGDKRRIVGREEEGGIRDLFRFRQAAHRERLCKGR